MPFPTRPEIGQDPWYATREVYDEAIEAAIEAAEADMDTVEAAIERVDPGTGGSNRQRLKVIDGVPEWQDDHVFDVRDDGASGDGSTDDTASIATAQAAAAAVATADRRAILALAPGKAHKIGKRIASQVNGGIFLERGVSLDGRGATLLLADNASFVTNRWPLYTGDNDGATTVTATITANVAVAAVQYTVDSTTGFAADDEVFVRLNDNEWDDVEVKDTFYAKVLTVDDATHITLDRPTPVAMTVASTEDHNRVIRKLYEPWDGGYIRDLTLIDPRTGSANAEAGLYLSYVRNIQIDNITAEHPGAGAVLLAYCESVTARNIRVRKSEMQLGQTSKGRALNIWNSRNITIENFYAEAFEGYAVFIESYCRGIVIDGMHLVNNFAGRDNTTYALMLIDQGSDLRVRNLLVEGEGGFALVTEGGTSGNNITFEDVWINVDSSPRDIPLTNLTGSLRIGSTLYGELKKVTVPFRMSPNMVYPNFNLPIGMYRRLKIYVNTETGLSYVELNNTTSGAIDITAEVVAGDLVDIPRAGHYGTVYPFNNYTPKRICIATDGTVPAGAWGFLEIEYWPVAADDGSDGRLMLPVINPPAYTVSNLTADRTFDADSTSTAELADVLGTLIADLKQSGWIA